MEKYFEILEMMNKESINDTLLYALGCIESATSGKGFSQEELFEMANLTKKTWLESDIDLCISRIADIIASNWEEIKENNWDNGNDIIAFYGDILSEY